MRGFELEQGELELVGLELGELELMNRGKALSLLAIKSMRGGMSLLQETEYAFEDNACFFHFSLKS